MYDYILAHVSMERCVPVATATWNIDLLGKKHVKYIAASSPNESEAYRCYFKLIFFRSVVYFLGLCSRCSCRSDA
jgi:hypothetical protein